VTRAELDHKLAQALALAILARLEQRLADGRPAAGTRTPAPRSSAA